jgi:hypothetical protein
MENLMKLEEIMNPVQNCGLGSTKEFQECYTESEKAITEYERPMSTQWKPLDLLFNVRYNIQIDVIAVIIPHTMPTGIPIF